MWRIFITEICILSAASICAQKGFSDSLLQQEYGYFNETDVFKKQELLIKKVNIYMSHGIYDISLVNEINRVEFTFLSQEGQKNFYWNAALINYINGNERQASGYMEHYLSVSENDTSAQKTLLYVLINKHLDSSAVRLKIEKMAVYDPLFANLLCFNEILNYKGKHQKFSVISSYFVPGLGTAINGKPIKGILSLAIATGAIIGIVNLVEYGLYLNALLWGSGVGLKFYFGNIKLADKTFNAKEQKQKNILTNNCELKVNMLLKKYPLTLTAL
jgi:hypothetical protein